MLPFVKSGYFARAFPFVATEQFEKTPKGLKANAQSPFDYIEVYKCEYKIQACPSIQSGESYDWVDADTKMIMSKFSARLFAECSDGFGGMLASPSFQVPCTRCEEGFFKSGLERLTCEPCDGGASAAFLPLFVILVVVCLGIIYRCSTASVTRGTTNTLLLGAVLSILVQMLQTFGIVAMFQIQIPPALRGFLDLFKILLFDIDMLRSECVVGYDIMTRYSTQVVTPLFPILLSAVFLVTRPDKYRLLNANGMLYAVAYISLCRLSVKIFECQRGHPDFADTMIGFPEALCESSGSLVGLGLFGIMFYAVGLLSLFVYAAWVAPKQFHNISYRMATMFLFSRWNPSVWWFQPVVMVRNLLVALSPLFFQADGSMQLAFTGAIVTVYVLTVGTLGPWKARGVNLVDGVVNTGTALVCVFILGIGAMSIEQEALQERAEAYQGYIVICLCVSFLCLPGVFIRSIWTVTEPTVNLRPLIECLAEELKDPPNQTQLCDSITGVLTAEELASFQKELGIMLYEIFGRTGPWLNRNKRLYIRPAADTLPQRA